MSFDSVFHGAPSSEGFSSSGQASLGIDVSSGTLYFRTPSNGGWQPVAGGGGGTPGGSNGNIQFNKGGVFGGSGASLTVGGSLTIPQGQTLSAPIIEGNSVFNVMFYGAAGNGSTDDTAAVLAATTAASLLGGIVFFPSGTYLISGHIVLPNNGVGVGAQPYSHQTPIRWTGVSSDHGGQGQVPANASVLLMTYNGAGVAKIETYGLGVFEMDHLSLVDTSGDSFPFLLTTGTTLNIHDCAFVGSKSGSLCDQDVLLLGGSLALFADVNDSNAAFQGYDTYIQRNYFNGIRRAIYGKTYCQSTNISCNFIGPACGSTLSGGAAMEFDGTGGQNSSNQIVNNRFEIGQYAYGAKFLMSDSNYCAGNDFEDATGVSTSTFYFDVNSVYNMVINMTRGAISYTTEVTDLSGTTTILTSAQTGTNVIGVGAAVTQLAILNVTSQSNLQALGTATSGANFNSVPFNFNSSTWNGSAAITDDWKIQGVVGAGANPTSALAFIHTGSSGNAFVNLSTTEVVFAGGTNFNVAGSLNMGSSTNASFNGETFQNNSTLLIRTTTAATSGANQSSPLLEIEGTYWTGAASATDIWEIQDVVGSGTNPTSTLTFVHVGSPTSATISIPRLGSSSADMRGSVSSAPTGIVASTVVVAVGAATATFTVTSTEGFTIGDTVNLSASGWTAGSGLASTIAAVASVASTTSMVLTYVSGGPWVAGTYSSQTGTLTQTGGTSVSVIFATAYTNTPTVVVTPTSNAGAFYLSAISNAGFTITYVTSGTQTFNYVVIGNPN